MEFIQEQSAILSQVDSKAEVNLVDSVVFEEGVNHPKPEVSMTAQRKRRAQRMARRPQRLALGTASDHAAEITRAILLVEAKNESTDEANLEGNRDLNQKSPTFEEHGTDGVQSNEGSLAEDDACLVNAKDPNTEEQSTSKDQRSPSSSYTEEKREKIEGGDKLFSEIVPAKESPFWKSVSWKQHNPRHRQNLRPSKCQLLYNPSSQPRPLHRHHLTQKRTDQNVLALL